MASSRAPKDVYARRLDALRALVAQWGGAAHLGRKLGYANHSYVSQLLSGFRPLTEKAARSIEAKLDLAAGWMDQDVGPNGKPKPAAIDVDRMALCVSVVAACLEEARISPAPAKVAELVAIVYAEPTEPREEQVRRLIRLLR